MDRLIRDPAERLALARGGQAYVLEAHTPQRRAGELNAIRRILVERRRIAA